MNKICLTARSRVRKFPADKYDEFVRVLETLDETTLRQTINQPSDVLLDDRGRLQCNGFTLTPLAMSQLCTHVARGLHSLATDIAGENRSARGYDHAVSVPVAARIINECIKLRFSAPDGLLGRDMIQNHRDREVEGIVGPRYRYLPSSQLLTGATDMLESHDVPMTFSGGELRGRRMCVTYLSQDTLGRTPSGGHLLGGAYFTNSEAGECGVRGALMLSLGTTSLRCLAPFNRISHVGRTFTKRLGRMLGSVLSRWEGLSSAAAAANTRLAVPLELLDDNDRLKKSRRSKIIRQLRTYLEKSTAEMVTQRAIFLGGIGTQVPAIVTKKELESRTVYAVFHALLAAADGHYPEVRENLERCAFDVLTNKLTLL